MVVSRFLLVSLTIDAVLGEVTISERRQNLTEMTKGGRLGDAYTIILARIKALKGGKSRLGLAALMWVSNSEHPLSTSELCHALGVKTGSEDLDIENVPEIRTVLGCSLGLVTVEASSSTVRLVHFTLQEYLSDNPGLFQNPHSMIAEVCLTYLNFRCVRKLSPTLSLAPSTVPLVGYASCYWGEHIRREGTRSVNPLALELLVRFEEHISSRLFLLRYHEDIHWWGPAYDGSSSPKGFTGLHGAAFLGIAEIVAALLAMREWDINATDARGRTALAWAAVGGHEDVVNMLLQRKDLNPDAADTKYRRTPLWWAAGGGHEGVVKLLLEREDINPNAADTEYGRTPFLWAARGGHEGVVKLLLERGDINPSTTGIVDDQTPLSLAARRGHQGVVKMLLEREDINPNTADIKYGRTPLSWAAEHGYHGVIKLLLEREDINPNTADTFYDRTPLSWAAESGHEGAVKLLLEREDTNPSAADTDYGQTPLSLAAEGGHHGVVKLLLGRKDINPNTADTIHGQTPLGWAAKGGHEGVVNLLLAREDIDPNTADAKCGRTPLGWAAMGGHEGVVNLLLAREDIDTNTADAKYGRTPLGWAAQRGCEGVVRLLSERDDVNPNTPDLICETALDLAMSRGHAGIVELLSKRKRKPSPPVLADVDEVPGHSSPEPSGLPQSSSQPIPSACPPLPKPHIRPLFGVAIYSLIFLLYCLLIIGPIVLGDRGIAHAGWEGETFTGLS